MKLNASARRNLIAVCILSTLLLFQNCSRMQSWSEIPSISAVAPFAPPPPPAETPVEPIPNPPIIPPANCTNNLLSGQGTAGQPYLIEDLCDFKSINQFPAAQWLLIKDLDFSQTTMPLKDFMVSAFSGVFDGNAHKLKNFKFVCVDDNCELTEKTYGLFQTSDGAEFKNFTAENFVFKLKSKNGLLAVGGLVGTSYQSRFSKIKFQTEIEADGDFNYTGLSGLGGLVGTDTRSEFDQIYVDLNLVGEKASPFAVGALGGRACSSKISNVMASGDIRNIWMAGGLVGGCGYGGSFIEISHSVFTGSVNYFSKIIEGQNYGGWGPCRYVSGLGELGYTTSTITNSFWTGGSQCAEALTQNYFKFGQISQSIIDNFDPALWTKNPNAIPMLTWIFGKPTNLQAIDVTNAGGIIPVYGSQPASEVTSLAVRMIVPQAVANSGDVSVSCENCTFEINNSGSFASNVAGIKNNDIIKVRHRSGATNSAVTNSTIVFSFAGTTSRSKFEKYEYTGKLCNHG